MGCSYYLIHTQHHPIKIGYSVNGNFFWEITLDQLINYVKNLQYHIEDDYDYDPESDDKSQPITFEDFLFKSINGLRHVSPEEFSKWEQTHTKGQCFPVYTYHNCCKCKLMYNQFN